MPSAQLVALTALCIHYSSLTILMHLSRTRQPNSNYRAASAVVMTELFKLIISIVFAIYRLVVLLLDRQSNVVQASPNARFQPQFDGLSLKEEDEEEEEENLTKDQAARNHQLEEENHTCKPDTSKRSNEDSDPLISDHQIHTTSARVHQREISSENYISNQSGKRKRLISGQSLGTLSPNMEMNETSNQNSMTSDYSHRMSVAASPRLIHPSNRSKSPIHLAYLILEAFSHLRASVFSQGWWLLGIPAVMFVTQNNLQYLAASNLSVPLFQITYQLKILTTALCSVVLLKRNLKKTQWISLLILTAGVAIVQSSSQAANKKTQIQPRTTTIHDSKEGVTRTEIEQVHTMNQPLGLIAVVAACLSSGFASVYLERMFKSTGVPSSRSNQTDPSKHKFSSKLVPKNLLLPSSSIWIKNIQLSSFGLIFSLVIVFLQDHFENPIQLLSSLISSLLATLKFGNFNQIYSDSDSQNLSFFYPKINRPNFFIGFTKLTWIVIIFQVLGGILNSFVMKFSNNINKNFSICLSIILSIFLSKLFLSSESSSSSSSSSDQHQENHFNFHFFVGSFFVFFSTWLFNL